MATPHNSAAKGDIARTVLMPGDPLRAEFIAKKYLDNVKCYNQVRGMLGFTGEYKGVRVSVQGSGMGMPSMGIYSWELYSEYDVENIIRVGSTGGLQEKVKLGDIIIGLSASTDSNYTQQFEAPGIFAPTASWALLEPCLELIKGKDNCHVGNVLSSDIFYTTTEKHLSWKKLGILGVEMESAALYTNAAVLGKNALTILSVSDLPLTGEGLSAEERQTSFTEMMELALETAAKLD